MTTLLLFALLAFLTALSVLWSIAPGLSYVEAGRTFAYLAIFAAAVAAARLVPEAAPRVLQGLAIGTLIPVGYALVSRVWPGALAEDELSNRLGQPFDYWNAVGVVAAMAVPILLWLGVAQSRQPGRADRGLSGDGRAASSPSSSRSRAARRWPPRSGRSPGSRSCRCGSARCPCSPIPLAAAAARRRLGALEGPVHEAAPAALGEGGRRRRVRAAAVRDARGAAARRRGRERGVSRAAHRRRGCAARVGIAAVVVAVLVPLAGVTSVAFSDRGIGDRARRAHERDQDRPRGGRLARARVRVLAREVLARGLPRLRRPAARGRRRRRLREGAPPAPRTTTPRSPGTPTAGCRRRWPTSACSASP